MTEAEYLEDMKEKLDLAQNCLVTAMRMLNEATTSAILAGDDRLPTLIRKEYRQIESTEDRLGDIRTGRNL